MSYYVEYFTFEKEKISNLVEDLNELNIEPIWWENESTQLKITDTFVWQRIIGQFLSEDAEIPLDLLYSSESLTENI